MPKGAEPEYKTREHVLGPYGVVKVVKMEKAIQDDRPEDGQGDDNGDYGPMTQKQRAQQANPGAQKKSEKKGDGHELSNAAGGGRLDDVQRILDECDFIEIEHLNKKASGRHNHDSRGDNHTEQAVNNRLLAGMTPLMYAAGFGHLPIVQLLCRLRARTPSEQKDRILGGRRSGKKICDINLQDLKYGMTALHQAAANDHPEVVEFLLQNGADTSIRDRNGRTAQDRAMRPTYGRRHSRVFEAIMEHHELNGTQPESDAAPTRKFGGATTGRNMGGGGGAKFAQKGIRPGSHPHQHQMPNRPKSLETLSLADVGSLLVSLNLGAYVESFRVQEIDGATLAHCEEDDLEMLGMAFRPKRQRLLAAIDEYLDKGVDVAALNAVEGNGLGDTVGGGLGRSGRGSRENIDPLEYQGLRGGESSSRGSIRRGWTSREGRNNAYVVDDPNDAQENELKHWYGRRAGQSTKGISKPHLYY
jgi:hypothetical protein